MSGETRTYEYARNAAGELTSLIDRNAPRPDGDSGVRTTSITRDIAGRLRRVNESWDGGRDSVYHYQMGGLINDVSVDGRIGTDGAYQGGRRMAYTYDDLDRVTNVAVRQSGAPAAEDQVTRMSYWPSDAQKRLTKANETVEMRYFADDGRIIHRTVAPDTADGADDKAHEYTYDTNGNRRTDERGEYTYNARDQLTHWKKAGSGSVTNPDRDVTYRPAGDGRLQGTTEIFSAPDTISTTRVTDNEYLGERLDSATVTTTAADGSPVADGVRQLRYGYDIFGSLLTIKTAKTAQQNPPASVFETSTQYTYDSFERLLSSRDDQDDDGQADGDHEVYCYDALDRRDRRVSGVENIDNEDPDSFNAQRTACRTPPDASRTLDYSYLGLGEQLTRENTDSGKGPRTYDYTPDGMRLGQRAKSTIAQPAKFRPYETDAQGNVVALEDPSRSEASPGDNDNPAPEAEDRYQLEPYGDDANTDQLSPATEDNPFRYQSHYLDSTTATYDMQARAYRPSLGRFLSQDRFEDPSADLTLQQDPLTNNRYGFLAGNPTNSLEYNGHYNCGGNGQGCENVSKKRQNEIDAQQRASTRRDRAIKAANQVGFRRGYPHELLIKYYTENPERANDLIRSEREGKALEALAQRNAEQKRQIKLRHAASRQRKDSGGVRGFAEGARDAVSETVSAVVHPRRTVKAVVTAASDPAAAGRAIFSCDGHGASYCLSKNIVGVLGAKGTANPTPSRKPAQPQRARQRCTERLGRMS